MSANKKKPGPVTVLRNQVSELTEIVTAQQQLAAQLRLLADFGSRLTAVEQPRLRSPRTHSTTGQT